MGENLRGSKNIVDMPLTESNRVRYLHFHDLTVPFLSYKVVLSFGCTHARRDRILYGILLPTDEFLVFFSPALGR
jgi:hypothetical protein